MSIVGMLDLAIAHLEQMPQGGVQFYTQEDLDAVPDGSVLENDASLDCAVRARLVLMKLREDIRLIEHNANNLIIAMRHEIKKLRARLHDKNEQHA